MTCSLGKLLNLSITEPIATQLEKQTKHFEKLNKRKLTKVEVNELSTIIQKNQNWHTKKANISFFLKIFLCFFLVLAFLGYFIYLMVSDFLN